MAEQLDLASPERSTSGTMTWKPFLLHLNVEEITIKAAFRGSNGEYMSVGYKGGVAAPMLRAALNPAASPKSAWRLIMEEAISDGKLRGTISGAPD